MVTLITLINTQAELIGLLNDHNISNLSFLLNAGDDTGESPHRTVSQFNLVPTEVREILNNSKNRNFNNNYKEIRKTVILLLNHQKKAFQVCICIFIFIFM